MTNFEKSLLERLADVGYPLLYFDGKCVNDMSEEELKLLCGWLGHQFLSRECVIEINMIQNENKNPR